MALNHAVDLNSIDCCISKRVKVRGQSSGRKCGSGSCKEAGLYLHPGRRAVLQVHVQIYNFLKSVCYHVLLLMLLVIVLVIVITMVIVIIVLLI